MTELGIAPRVQVGVHLFEDIQHGELAIVTSRARPL